MIKSGRFALLALTSLALFGQSAEAGTPLDRYVNWAQEHFKVTTAEFNAQFNRVGPSADPDGDGLSNLAEYALGTDPLSHSAYPGAAMTPLPGWGDSSLLTLSASVRADDPNLIIIPQVSEDGDTWWPFLPFNANSAPLDNFFAAQYSDGPVVSGMQAVQYAARPDSPLKNPQFIRLAIVRFAATAAAPGVPSAAAPPTDSASNRTAAAGLAPLFTTTPAIPGLLFTNQTSAALGAELMSNTITLRGFAGWITVTAPPGLTLIVNGKPVVGSTAKVRAGYTLALKATADKTSTTSVTYPVKFGNSTTVNWTVAPKQALPVNVPAGTMAGYTPVNASVGQGGDANISLPITVSPGIAGMEPKLSINYNSGGGNGQLGIGFGLGGLSAISRVGANKAQDGLRGSVKLDANDRFALDGARLISITGADGAAGTTYEKEITDFSRIQSIGTLGSGPQSWKVETKSGLIFEYGAPSGNIDGSRLMLNGSVLVWYVSKVADLAGNEMRFHYAIDGGTVYLQYIDYTFNTAGGADSKCRVDFTYASRPDAKTTYQLGQAFTSNQRLTAVEATHDGQIVRHYDLEYQQAELSGVSQLVRVTERGIKPTNGGAWPSFPPTVFEWDQNSAPNHVYSDTTKDPNLAKMGFSRSPPSLTFQGDFGGTGRMGIMQIDDHGGSSFYLAMGNADGTFSFRQGMSEFTAADQTDHKKNSTYSIVRTGDFNGDGKTDVLHMTRSGGANWVALSNGDGTFTVKRAEQIGGLYNLPYSGDYSNQVLAMDLNADGRTDIVVLYATSDSRVFLSNGDGSFTEKAEDAAFKALHLSDGRAYYNWVLPGDYNGDGLADILIMAYSGTHTLALSNGDGTFTIRGGAALGGIDKQGFAYSYSYISSGDYNGDGLTDVVCFINSGGKATASINYCHGDGTFTPAAFPDSLKGLGFSNSGMPYSQFLSGDFNGDGIADILHAYYSASSLGFLAYGQGDAGFAAVKNGSLSGLNNLSYTDRVFIGDFDGDGRDDVLNLVYGASGNWLVRSTGFDSNRVRKVTNGHLGYTSFQYKPMTDPSVYTKGSTAQYPVINLQTPMYVVDTMTMSNGVDDDPDSGKVGTLQATPISYDYSDVQVYLDGRGFQQAKMVTETNQATGVVTKTYYGTKDGSLKDIPLLSGYPVATEVYARNGNFLSISLNNWTLRERSDNTDFHRRYQVFAHFSSRREFDVNSNALVRVTTTQMPAPGQTGDVDRNGNVLSMKVKTAVGEQTADSDSYVDTTVNTWGEKTDSGKYMLGRLMSATVTKTAPGGYSDTRTTSFDYDFARTGQLTKEVIEPGNATPGITHTKTYHIDACGNIDQSTETAWAGTGAATMLKSRNKFTTYSADRRFIETTRNDLGHKEITLHESLLGQVTDQEGPNHIKTHWDFDGFARPVHELRADGTETRTWHRRATPGTNGAPARAVYSVTTQSTATPAQTIWYDVLDREIQRDAVSFDGRTVSKRKAFNTRGQVVQDSEPFFAGTPLRYTIILYDDAGRVTRQTASGNRITTTTYDGLTTTVQNPKEQGTQLTSSRTVTVAGKLASATDQKGHILRYEHDGFGLLRKVTDHMGNVTKMDYDKRGQRISISEPNTGISITAYNGFGQTILSLTPDKRKTTHLYDVLGRETVRVEPEGKTVWTYDFLDSKNPDDGPSRRSVGKLLRVTSPGYQQDVTYDYLGRPSLTTTRIAGGIFNTSTAYDYTGRADSLSYPTGFAIRNVYNQFGHLAEVRDASSGLRYWLAYGVNARGQIEKEVLGEDITATWRTYDPDTGRISAIQTGDIENGVNTSYLQNLRFRFDAIGNLDSRTDDLRGFSETFDYDSLNRLSGTHLTGASAETPNPKFEYDDLGDLTGRTEVGTLTYGGPGLLPSFAKPAGPHAVTALTGRPGGAPDLRFGYDLRGNRGRVDYLAQGKWVNSQRITYNTSNLPTIIIAGAAESIFAYGPDRARIRQVQLVSGHVSLDRLYVGSLYEREKRGATYRHVHYIPAGGGMVAIRQTEEGPSAFTERTLYLHKDHLGSIESISGGNGALAEHLNYDAWGRRRTVGLQGTATTVAYTGATTKLPDTTPRGFTGHEMLDAFNLVHMNGRLYDPLTGRFLSADPIVQAKANLQSFNRYSYVLNSPLSRTDPSGFVSTSDWGYYSHASYGQLYHRSPSEQKSDPRNPNSTIIYSPRLKEKMFQGVDDSSHLTGSNSQLQRLAGIASQQAFTGTQLAGGSSGDAQRAGVHYGFANGAVTSSMASAFGTSEQGEDTSNDGSYSLPVMPKAADRNDLVNFIGAVVNLPIAVLMVLANQTFGSFSEFFKQYRSFFGTGDHGGFGILWGDSYGDGPRASGYAGVFGAAMSLAHWENIWGSADTFERGQLWGHNVGTLPGRASDSISSAVDTFGQMSVGLKAIGITELYIPGWQSWNEGQTLNTRHYNEWGHNGFVKGSWQP